MDTHCMIVSLCEDVKQIKHEVVNMKVSTDKMSAHVDLVENHISWVTSIANFFLPKFKKHRKDEENTDEFFKRFNELM